MSAKTLNFIMGIQADRRHATGASRLKTSFARQLNHLDYQTRPDFVKALIEQLINWGFCRSEHVAPSQ